MIEKITDKFNEYIVKQKSFILQHDVKKNIAIKIRNNYQNSMKMSDNEVRRNSNNSLYSNEVYYKLWKENMSFSGNPLGELLNKFYDRTMKEDEYNYLLNTSPSRIVRYAKKKPATREAILQKFSGDKK